MNETQVEGNPVVPPPAFRAAHFSSLGFLGKFSGRELSRLFPLVYLTDKTFSTLEMLRADTNLFQH